MSSHLVRLHQSRWGDLSPTTLTLILVAYFLLMFNRTLFGAIWTLFTQHDAGGWLFLASLGLFIGCCIYLLFSLLLWPVIGKPIMYLLLIASSVAAYFMDSYGVAITPDMITNVFQTNTSEAASLMSPALFWHVALFGLLPALLLSRVHVLYAPSIRFCLYKVIAIASPLLVMAVILGLGSKQYTYFIRNHHTVYSYLNPYNYVTSTINHVKDRWLQHNMPFRPLTDDARLANPSAAGNKIVVLVVGETARAANFGLQGYTRHTTPALRRIGVHYFDDAHSCGTETAVSVPCMFSGMGRDNYDAATASHTGNLLDVLKQAGVHVLWLDNDNGCKDVCDRVAHHDYSDADDPRWCADGDCLDGILVDHLHEALATLQRPALLVLHLKGSHGPAYYRRYPKAFRRFTPTCNTEEVQTCKHQAIVNTYDNTLLYTDHILASVIQRLKTLPGSQQSALLYLSDHGESLGEDGLFLHGMPYGIAPTAQTHIPFLMWFSSSWKAASPEQVSCVDSNTRQRVSQDNLFDTVLGLFHARTAVYQRPLDLTANCLQTIAPQ